MGGEGGEVRGNTLGIHYTDLMQYLPDLPRACLGVLQRAKACRYGTRGKRGDFHK